MTPSEQVQVSAPAEDKMNAYFSATKSMQVVSSRGRAMMFIGGRYVTKDEGEIADLDGMALQNNGQVYKDPEMLYLTASQLDPMNALREKFRKEFQAEKESYLNPEQDFGPSVQDRIVTASTSSIKAITVK